MSKNLVINPFPLLLQNFFFLKFHEPSHTNLVINPFPLLPQNIGRFQYSGRTHHEPSHTNLVLTNLVVIPVCTYHNKI